MAKLIFIGSGCWQGIPAPFCDDKISQNVNWESKDFRFRTSLQITTDQNKTILVELTPDLRLQAWKYKIQKPDSILISHAHWDHFSGLMELDWFAEKNQLKVYGNTTSQKFYTDYMNHIKIDFHVFESFQSFEIDNIKITPLPVEHSIQTHGFLFENTNTNHKFAYLTDLNGIPEETLSLINDVDVATIDVTYLEADSDNDKTHLQQNEIQPLIQKLNIKQIILTNIGSFNNLNHDDLTKKFSSYTIAYDGLELEL